MSDDYGSGTGTGAIRIGHFGKSEDNERLQGVVTAAGLEGTQRTREARSNSRAWSRLAMTARLS
jgi:hypothetical protein